jgi:hypothetical protein
LEHKRKSKKATGKILNAAAGPSNEIHRHDVRTQKKQIQKAMQNCSRCEETFMVARRQIGTQEKIQKSNWQDSECSCGTEQRGSSSRRQNAEEATKTLGIDHGKADKPETSLSVIAGGVKQAVNNKKGGLLGFFSARKTALCIPSSCLFTNT